MTFAVGGCQGTSLLQALFQLGQRFIHQRFYFRDIGRGAFALEQGDGLFVFLDLLCGVGGSHGNPKAVRAVGAANGRNPISIIAPCHRVIGASGGLTGFAGGLEAKQYLLALEGGGQAELVF